MKDSETCQNPLCNARLEPLPQGWRRTPRQFCSKRCRLEAWTLKQAAKFLDGLSDERAVEILRQLR